MKDRDDFLNSPQSPGRLYNARRDRYICAALTGLTSRWFSPKDGNDAEDYAIAAVGLADAAIAEADKQP